jgi:hypothetical protein
MLVLSPSLLFQQSQKDSAAEHMARVRTTAFPTMLTFALAEMAGRNTVTSENLVGARMLVGIILNLSEKQEDPKLQLPNKDLGQTPVKKAK